MLDSRVRKDARSVSPLSSASVTQTALWLAGLRVAVAVVAAAGAAVLAPRSAVPTRGLHWVDCHRPYQRRPEG